MVSDSYCSAWTQIHRIVPRFGKIEPPVKILVAEIRKNQHVPTDSELTPAIQERGGGIGPVLLRIALNRQSNDLQVIAVLILAFDSVGSVQSDCGAGIGA